MSTNPEGVVTVYKGYCIQATYYTSVDQVKEILGEATSRPKLSHKQTGHRRDVASNNNKLPPPPANASSPAPSGSRSRFQPPSPGGAPFSVENSIGSFQPPGLYPRQGSGADAEPHPIRKGGGQRPA
jgi:hypothetical protein